MYLTMKILSVRHKGLKRFIEDDDARGTRPDLLNRIRNIVAALIVADDMEGVVGPPGWRVHQLTGDRTGVRSIAASGNWRVTFTIEDGGISDLDLEDYH
jgi:proteic killer suppression protein